MMGVMIMMKTMLKTVGGGAGDSEECLDCEAQGGAGREAGHNRDDDHYENQYDHWHDDHYEN